MLQDTSQPNPTFTVGEIPENYHRFVLFDSPQCNDHCYWTSNLGVPNQLFSRTQLLQQAAGDLTWHGNPATLRLGCAPVMNMVAAVAKQPWNKVSNEKNSLETRSIYMIEHETNTSFTRKLNICEEGTGILH